MPGSGRKNLCKAPNCEARLWALWGWEESAWKWPGGRRRSRWKSWRMIPSSPPRWRRKRASAWRSWRKSTPSLDVFTEEPLKNSPLTAIDNVILTPHIGGSTYEAQEAVGYQIALQVKEYLKHGVIQNAVNVPSVSHDEYLELQPY